jgi:uncharacterized protein (DUF2236 family)
VTVGREDLERELGKLRREVRDPRAGIYGPDSINWKVAREAICFLGGGRAALLQLAHPFVAHAVDQHSHTRTDPLGRFMRTFANVFDMVFGDLDHALASARRVHGIHARVTGHIAERVGPFDPTSRYEANDEDALMWVHATLLDSALQAYELVVGPLGADERERYYAEARRFGWLFGVPDAAAPPDFAAFTAYNERMWQWLRVGKPAREMAGFLLHPPAARLRGAFAWYRTITAGLLPAPIREQYGLPFGSRERLLFRASLAAMRPLYRMLPAPLRQSPPYRDAVRRLKGRHGRDPAGVRVERWFLSLLDGGWA